MITTMDIEKAEASEAAVRERTTRLRRTHNLDGGEAIERARRAVEELREGKAAQDQALKARAAEVKVNASELKRLAAGLDKSGQDVAQAAQAAMEALRRLIEAAGAHNGAVEAAHGRLTELGLVLADEQCSAYEEGSGHGGVVRVGGRMFGDVPADVVVTAVVGALAEVEFGRYHGLAQAVHSARQYTAANSAAGKELLGRLPGA